MNTCQVFFINHLLVLLSLLICYYCTDVAEWVLNKCALSAGVSTSTVPNKTVDPVSIEVDGAEDDQNENNTGKCYPNGSCKPNWEPKEFVNH